MLDLTKIRALIAARQPKHTLPQDFYVDPDVFAFDLAAIYGQNWILAGFEAEVPEPGSYLALPVGQSPVVVVRGQDGALRGFYNSCRHRGAQICEHGRGSGSWLTCRYHQWTYGLDGKLANAPRMTADFDADAHGLRPIHVETVAGSIYVCLAEQPPRFADFREHVGPLLAPHNLTNAKLAFESTLVERANWKLVMENARECYHCAARHPELALSFPVRGRRPVQFADVQRFERFRSRMAEVGLETGPVEGEWWQAMRFPLNDGMVTLSMDGRLSCGKLMCDVANGDIGSMRWSLEPHCFAHATSDVTFMFSAMPTGPQETVVTSKWLVHKDAVEGVDYRVDELIELWTRTNLQDRDLCETNQRGVNSLGYIPGPYSEEAEALVMRFVDWYCDEATRYIDRHTRIGPRLAAVAGGS
jgi:glycine betaine catabolism A